MRGSLATGTKAVPSFGLILAITTAGIMSNTIVTPAIPDILDYFGRPDEDAGLLVAAVTMPGIIFAVVAGVLADRFGRREVIVPSLLLFGLAGGAVFFVDDFRLLLGLRALQGVGSSGMMNLAIVLIGDFWTGEDRVRYLGRNAAVLTAMLAILPLIAGALTDLGSWRTPFLLYLPALGAAVIVWRGLPPGVSRDVSLWGQLREAGPVLVQRHVTLAIIGYFMVFMVIFGLVLTVLPVYLDDQFGVSATMRGVVLGIPAIAAVLASSNGARIVGRIGKANTLVLASLSFAVSLIAVGLAPSLVLLTIGVFFFGFGDGAGIPVLQEIAVAAASDESRGAVVATQVSAARLGQTVGPVVAASAAAAFGAPIVFVLAGVFCLVVMMPVVVLSARLAE